MCYFLLLYFQTTTASATQKTEKKQAWERSIGGFGSKNSLKGLVVKKKTPKTNSEPTITETRSENKTEDEKTADQVNDQSPLLTSQRTTEKNNGMDRTSLGVKNGNITNKPAGLGLLGNYSDSDSNQDSD